MIRSLLRVIFKRLYPLYKLNYNLFLLAAKNLSNKLRYSIHFILNKLFIMQQRESLVRSHYFMKIRKCRGKTRKAICIEFKENLTHQLLLLSILNKEIINQYTNQSLIKRKVVVLEAWQTILKLN